MSKLIELSTSMGESNFLIEATEVEDEQVTPASGNLEKRFDRLIEITKPFCETIITSLEKLSVKPSSASAEFGLSVSAEGNIFVVKASGEASVKITLNWNNLAKS